MEEKIYFFDSSVAESTHAIEIRPSSEGIIPIVVGLDSIKGAIDSFVNLKKDWDGYNGVPVFDDIATKAKSFISILDDTFIDKISDVFPNPTGTLVIEWENDSEEKLSLEIGQDNFSYFIRYKNNPPEFINGENVTDNLKDIQSSLCKLFGKEIRKYILSE
jgi:hypothetical protein